MAEPVAAIDLRTLIETEIHKNGSDQKKNAQATQTGVLA
jgi:hypothetical protein